MEQTVRLYAEHVGRFLQTKDLPPVQDDEVAG